MVHSKNENLTTAVLLKICTAPECDISDIVEVIDTNDEKWVTVQLTELL